jgi:hypothetical protein
VFDAVATPIGIVTDVLTTQSSMSYDRKSNAVTITELIPGSLVTIPLP